MRATKKPPPHTFVVDLPRTDATAYNPNRPISGLIESQIRRLHEPERRLPRRHHTGVDVGMIKTEGEAAAYIARVTAAIHAHARATAKRPATRRRPPPKKQKATRSTRPRQAPKTPKRATARRTAGRRGR
jgi:hypothetical protein